MKKLYAIIGRRKSKSTNPLVGAEITDKKPRGKKFVELNLEASCPEPCQQPTSTQPIEVLTGALDGDSFALVTTYTDANGQYNQIATVTLNINPNGMGTQYTLPVLLEDLNRLYSYVGFFEIVDDKIYLQYNFAPGPISEVRTDFFWY